MDEIIHVDDSEDKALTVEKEEAETEFVQQVSRLQHVLAAELHCAQRMEASRAQSWEDLALHNAMQSSPLQSKRARTVGTQADEGDLRFYEGNDTAATMMPVEGMTGDAAAPEEGPDTPEAFTGGVGVSDGCSTQLDVDTGVPGGGCELGLRSNECQDLEEDSQT